MGVRPGSDPGLTLYFYDVGLAAWLIGIENSRQVATHPLRGGLFENLAVMEIVKHRLNNAAPLNLSFFRDSSGNGVDLVSGRGEHAFPLEIKAGETINDDYFKNLSRFLKVFPNTTGGAVIYAGNRLEARTVFSAWPITEIRKLLSVLP